MKIKFSILVILLFSFSNLFSQKKDWFDSEYQQKNYPDSVFYSYYSEASTKKDALFYAKTELSKKISTEMKTSSSSSSITMNAIFKDVFKENSTESSSITLSGLQEKISYTKRIRKKICHVFIYIEKKKLKYLTKSIYDDLLITIKGEINACEEMFLDANYTEAKNKGDQISLEIERLKRLKKLLPIFELDNDPIQFNRIIENFGPLFAKIKKQISDEEDYKYNKEQGDLKSLSNNYLELEKAIIFYKKSEKINPKLSLEDDLPNNIILISKQLYRVYCQKAIDFELEQRFSDAVNFYNKARDLFPGKKVSNEKETTTERIISCQNQLIEILISQGDEEFDDSPTTALSNYREAKDLISSMNRSDRIKEINKLILKAEKQIQKDNKKQSKIYRKQKIKDQRNISPHRILFSFGGGFQNSFIDNSDIFSNPISIDVDMWHLSSTLGYRLNLPDVIKTSKTGFEKSKGNVIAIFYKQGNTITKFNNTNFESSFNEIEFGYILKERIRLSLGKGSRSISNNNNIIEAPSIPTNYNCATGSFYMHFGRLSLETSITYLLSDKFAFEEAKLNANLSIRFYFYKKIYKTVKENIN